MSTSEVEYVAMAHGAKTAFAIEAVLEFDVYEGNEGAKALAENLQGSHRRKHIDARFHFLRGAGEVVILVIASVYI